MSKTQERRTHKVVLTVLTILYIFITIGLLAEGIPTGMPLITIIQISGIVIPCLLGFFMYFFFRDYNYLRFIFLIGFVIGYAGIMILGQVPLLFVYGIPIMIITVLYLSPKLTLGGNIIIIIINIIQIAKRISTSQGDELLAAHIMIQVISIIAAALASIMATNLLKRFIEENANEIQEHANLQLAVANTITHTAEDIVKNFDATKTMLTQLSDAISGSHFVISNIADSTESTAQSIQTQSEMSASIQTNMKNTEDNTSLMEGVIATVEEKIELGIQMLDTLKQQSIVVEDANKVTVQSTNELVNQINGVNAITNTIADIQNQTKLLALNASIEAARAGEAGRGFAIVAQEISNLSEQTQDATSQIAALLESLIQNSGTTQSYLAKSTESINEQNKIIESVNDGFVVIKQESGTLKARSLDIFDNIRNMADANNTLADNIHQLSASSEEVASSVAEGLRESETIVDILNNVNGLLEKLYTLVDGLKETIE